MAPHKGAGRGRAPCSSCLVGREIVTGARSGQSCTQQDEESRNRAEPAAGLVGGGGLWAPQLPKPGLALVCISLPFSPGESAGEGRLGIASKQKGHL